MQKVLIIGPAHPLRGGGITTFNHRLAKEFIEKGYDCEIVSFSLQYPSFLFPGKSQYSDEPAPEDLTIHSLINSVHPLNWLRVGRKLKKWKPDLVIVRFWLPLMGPSLGTVLRQLKKNNHTKIICIADNVVPHEKRFGDKPFTKYFLKACDAFVTMSEKVLTDLRSFEKTKPAVLVPHPLYDNFGEKVSKEKARRRLRLQVTDKIIVFFGFIRRYKGLNLLLQAMADRRIKEQNIKLLIAGEFYEDEETYRNLIATFKLQNRIILHNHFIADVDVKNYICAGDCIVQPYINATQSGVTPLAYHFEKPMIVTNVGGLPALVPHQKVGLVAEPNPQSIAGAILQFYSLGEDFFLPQLREEKKKYSWEKLVEAIVALARKVE
ncbi:glycosyltransferase [Flavisolibacter ginsenosidimutans]|uniref:Glycosyltransferase n=1 Tax=Flavisolibacter ginsenosidimutans TaxID=661481 RepID=A0A5B8UE47_9BACT|nr:glycosyltransferase [Flavisolibacter ginsenosidimutans]QEC54844.1 glycosyltransferase [Flavisolibacter ginsenosidimutans]